MELSARVHLVADKLQLKAQEAQAKGNQAAAQSLGDSVSDLRRAAAMLHELTGGRPRRDSDAMSVSSVVSESPGPPRSGASPKDLVAKLGRVEALLGKKSEEMKQKSNENAARALYQSSLTVKMGAQHIVEQQQITRALVATAKGLREQVQELCQAVLAGDELPETIDDASRERAMTRVKELTELFALLRGQYPCCESVNELQEALASGKESTDEIQTLAKECEDLRQQLLKEQEQHEEELLVEREGKELLTKQCTTLEEALQKLETEYREQRERELAHLNSLHERQKETHEELKLLLLAKEEEVTALKVQAETWMNQLGKQREALEEIHAQRKEDRVIHERELTDVRQLMSTRDEEIRELRDLLASRPRNASAVSLHGDEDQLVALRRQMEELQKQLAHAQSVQNGSHHEHDDTDASKSQPDHVIDVAAIRSEYESQLTAQEQRLAELQQQLEDFKSASEADKLKIDELESVIAENDEEIDQLRDELRQEQTVNLVEGGVKSGIADEKTQQLTQEIKTLSALLANVNEKLDEEWRELFDRLSAFEPSSDDLKGLTSGIRRCVKCVVAKKQEYDNKELEHQMMVDSMRDVLGDTVEPNDHDRKVDVMAALVKLAELVEEASDRLKERGAETQTRSMESPVDESELQTKHAGLLAEADALRAQVEQLQEELGRQKSEIESSSRTIEEITLSKTVLESELIVLREKIESQEDTELTNTSISVGEEVEALKNQLDELTTVKASLENELKDLQQKYATQADELEKATSALDEETAVLGDQLKEVTTANESLQTELFALRENHDGQIAELEKRVSTLEEETTTLKKQLEDATSAKDSLVSEFNELRGQHETQATHLERTSSALEEEIAKLKSQLEEVKRSKSSLQTELNHLRETHESRAADLEKTSTASEEEIAALKAKLEDVQTEYDRYRTRSHTAMKKIEKRAELLNGMKKDNERLAKEASEALEAKAAAEQKEAVMQARLDEVERAIQMREEEFAQRSLEFAEAAKQLESQRDEAKSTNVSLEQKLQGFANHVAKFEAEKLQIASDVNELMAQKIAAKEVDLEQEKALVATLQTQIEEANADLLAKQTQIEDLEAAVEQAKATIAQKRDVVAAQGVSTAKKDQEIKTLLEEHAMEKSALKETIVSLEGRIIQSEKTVAASTKELERLRSQLAAQATSNGVSSPASLDKLDNEVAETGNRPTSTVTVGSDELTSRDRTIRELRARLLELEDTLEEQKADAEMIVAHKAQKEELRQARGERLQKQAEQQQEAIHKKRKTQVNAFRTKANSVIDELQRRLEEYSAVFREACAVRDEVRASTPNGGALNGEHSPEGRQDYEECLVFKSGVVIKAGSSFSLPVFCEKRGLRVVWKFSVTEDNADVGFALSVDDHKQWVIPSERVNDLSGVFDVTTSGTTLLFEWDNTFSWLNEKTLDYHVSVLEPISPEKKQLRGQERELREQVTRINQQLALFSSERDHRLELMGALNHLLDCGQDRGDLVAMIQQRKGVIQEEKNDLQSKMEELKNQLGAFVKELADLDDDERVIASAWDSLAGEREDVQMTIHLSENHRFDVLVKALETENEELEAEIAELARQGNDMQ